MTETELKNISVEPNKEESTVRIEGEIPFTYLEKERAGALAAVSKGIKADGFREGHIPEKVVIERVGEMALLQEMAERALRKTYPDVVKHHALEVIGYPQISITKLATDNPFGFSITVAVMPEVALPDYKKLAAEENKKKEKTDVTDKEVEKQTEEILRQKVAYERIQKKAAEKKDTDNPKEIEDVPSEEEVKDEQLPELTDELVKTLGQPGQFETVADFKSKIREHLEIQKKQDVDAKHRASITDAIIEKTDMILPAVLIETELNQMFAQMDEDIKRAGLTMDGYLEHIKKTKEDLKKEWTPAAEKRAKLQIVLNEIAEKEDVDVDEKEVEHQMEHILEQHKDADKERVRVYVTSTLQNDAVMKMLESQ